MPIEDIPLRGIEDGETQLSKLRSYLKDTEEASYKIPDDYLIGLLTKDDKVVVWRYLTKAPESSIPWSYLIGDNSYVSLIRSLSGDTNELSVILTDYEILELLEVLPLKHLVLSIKQYIENGESYPLEDCPLKVMRELMDDISGIDFPDRKLLDMVFKGKKDPYSVVIQLIECESVTEAAIEARQFGGGLASIDGISFSTNDGGDSQKGSKANIEIIKDAQVNSVYIKESDYNWYVNGKDLAEISGDWYAI